MRKEEGKGEGAGGVGGSGVGLSGEGRRVDLPSKRMHACVRLRMENGRKSLLCVRTDFLRFARGVHEDTFSDRFLPKAKRKETSTAAGWSSTASSSSSSSGTSTGVVWGT